MSNDENIHIDTDGDADTKKSHIFVRIAVIIGMLLILFLIAVAIVKYVPKFISSFGQANVSLTSLFSPKTTTELTASIDPSQVASGSKFTLNWTNSTTDSGGAYEWSYQCVAGVTVSYNSIDGVKPVVCNTLFPLPATSSGSYTLSAMSTSTEAVSVPNSVSYWDANVQTMKYSGATTFTIVPVGFVGTTDTNTNSAAYAPAGNSGATSNSNTAVTTQAPKTTTSYGTTAYQNGPADLAISLVKVAQMLPDGTLEQTNTLSAGQRVVVQFRVSNVGSGRSGNWTLSARLPTTIAAEQNYASTAEPSIAPGDSYLMTLAFDSFDPSQNSIQIAVNAADANQANNILTIGVTGGGTSYNNNYNYNNNSNCYYSNGAYVCNNGNNYNYQTGNPDLAVQITAIGVMDPNTNQFYSTSNFNSGQKIAVEFQVQNVGGGTTGPWSFTANLPSNTQGSYYSGTENSLAPGQIQTFTLGFNNPRQGSQAVTIQLNPENGDSNSGNNYASQSFYVSY